MGTRSLTHIKEADLDSKTLVTIYKQFDGYPEHWGLELQAFLKDMQICNGIGIEQKSGTWANGSGCLAAQLIGHVKAGIGEIYIEAPDSKNYGEQYTYTIYFKDFAIYFRCTKGKDATLIYDGPINGWDIKESEEE